MKKIAANVSHGRIKTFNPCTFGLRRFEAYLPRELRDTHQPVSLLSCLRVCSPCDVLWAMHTSPSDDLLAENYHLMVVDILQFVINDPNQKNFVRDYFRELANFWERKNFWAIRRLDLPVNLNYELYQMGEFLYNLQPWVANIDNRNTKGKLYLVAQFAYHLHLDYKLDDSDGGFGDHLRKVIRKYLCHGDGYHFPLGLNHMKELKTTEWIPDEN